MSFKRLIPKFTARAMLLALLVAASLAAVTSFAHAATSDADAQSAARTQQVDLPDVAMRGMFDPPTVAETQDLATLAEQYGIAFDEAIATYGWRRGFAQLVQVIATRHQDSFAGAAVDPDGTIWIAFKGAVPPDAASLVDRFEREVLELRSSSARITLVPDRGFSEPELNDRVIAAHRAVYNQSPLVSEVATEAEPRTGEIVVVARSLGPDLARTAADVASRLPEGVRVEVTFSPLVEKTAPHKGGQPMSLCTAGFVVVKDFVGPVGISTAAHCPNSQTMNGVALDFESQHESTYGDMQWHSKSGESFPDDFYAGSSSTWNANLRDVSGVVAPVVGSVVCKNGKSSYKSCDTVRSLGFCTGGSCNLVTTWNKNTVGGDSGGPWYNGNSAVGLSYGHILLDGAFRDIFTRADQLPNGLGGVRVLS